MKEILQQLLSMGPGLGAAVSGDGNAFAAFMDGYTRMTEQLEQRKRLGQQDAVAAEERERLRTRQDEADARARTDQEWQETQRRLALAESLSGAVDKSDTLPGAESAVDARFGLLPPAQQEAMAPVRDATLRGAGAKVTDRQRNELRLGLQKWLTNEYKGSEFAKRYAGGELTQAMPARLRQLAEALTGQSAFTEDDLYRLAESLKPAKAEPRPSDEVSWQPDDVMVGGKLTRAFFNPKTREYRDQQGNPVVVDPVPPRPPASTPRGVYPPAVQRRIDAKVRGYEANAVVKRTATMAEAVSFADSLSIDTKNPADDQALIYAFAKAMDPDSVVREGEYATVQKYAQSWADTFGFDVSRIFSNTSFLTPQARKQLKSTIRAKYAAARGQFENIRNEYGRQIERITGKPGGVEELPDFGAAFPSIDQPGAQPSPGRPKRGPSPFPGGQ